MSVLSRRRGGPDLVQFAGVTVIGRPLDLFAVLRAAHMYHFDGMNQSTGETGDPAHQGQQQGDVGEACVHGVSEQSSGRHFPVPTSCSIGKSRHTCQHGLSGVLVEVGLGCPCGEFTNQQGRAFFKLGGP